MKAPDEGLNSAIRVAVKKEAAAITALGDVVRHSTAMTLASRPTDGNLVRKGETK